MLIESFKKCNLQLFVLPVCLIDVNIQRQCWWNIMKFNSSGFLWMQFVLALYKTFVKDHTFHFAPWKESRKCVYTLLYLFWISDKARYTKRFASFSEILYLDFERMLTNWVKPVIYVCTCIVQGRDE